MAANGRVAALRVEGRGPTIWLAGTPDELREWMPLGIAGIVTNTVVLNQYAKQYGSVIKLLKQYFDITDKPVVISFDISPELVLEGVDTEVIISGGTAVSAP